MHCLKCGFDNPEDCLFCINCGAELHRESAQAENLTDEENPAVPAEEAKTETVPEENAEDSKPYAVAGMVCGIVSAAVSLICCCEVILFPFALAMGIIGLIFGIKALKKSKEYKSMAVCGVICSAVGVILSAVVFVLAFAMLSYADNFSAEQIKEYFKSFM